MTAETKMADHLKGCGDGEADGGVGRPGLPIIGKKKQGRGVIPCKLDELGVRVTSG